MTAMTENVETPATEQPQQQRRTTAAVVSADLRFEIEDLYADYAACLDEGRFGEWPAFFTETCTYKVVPRENFDRGLPLCTIWAESRGMLEDRVVLVRDFLASLA